LEISTYFARGRPGVDWLFFDENFWRPIRYVLWDDFQDEIQLRCETFFWDFLHTFDWQRCIDHGSKHLLYAEVSAQPLLEPAQPPQ